MDRQRLLAFLREGAQRCILDQVAAFKVAQHLEAVARHQHADFDFLLEVDDLTGLRIHGHLGPVLGLGADHVGARGHVEVDVLIATVVAHFRLGFLVIEEDVETHHHPGVARANDVDQGLVGYRSLGQRVVGDLRLHLVRRGGGGAAVKQRNGEYGGGFEEGLDHKGFLAYERVVGAAILIRHHLDVNLLASFQKDKSKPLNCRAR